MIELDRYEVERHLAVGGMAEVFLARVREIAEFDKRVVIKRLKPEFVDDPRMVAMFMDEVRVGALLEHPHLSHVYDAGIVDGVPYMVLEYIRGQELHVLCRRGLAADRFLPLGHAVELMRQAATAMGYFHAKRDDNGAHLEIVHCDISPTNLLVTDEGFLKIIDFGIARSRRHDPGQRDAIPGKLSYMSPEQAAREPLDHRSDIFSLAVVLYEITVGKRLFRGPAAEVVDRLQRGDVSPPTYVDRDFPVTLENIIMRALERYPSDRYQDAYDLAADLEDFLGETGLHAGPVRIARYLDELAASDSDSQDATRDEDAEYEEDDDELDFDRGLFSRGEGGAESARRASSWDEYDENDGDVAAALGMDVESYRRARSSWTRARRGPGQVGDSRRASDRASDPDDPGGDR